MAQRNAVERRWTAEEDELLLSAVANFGEQDNWKTVAQAVPGRTNKACRKRWLHSLSPSVKKSAWTPAEDHLLVDLYTIHGPKWSLIARQIHGRTDDACSKRYREALDPNLKKDEWTPDEDAKLMEVYSRIGGKWGQVGQELRRSGLACRNRHRMLDRVRNKCLRVPRSTVVSFGESQYLPEDLSQVLDDLSQVHDGLSQAHGDLSQSHEDLALHVPIQQYCPPEAYPSALGSEPSQGFRAPTPRMPESAVPPPFQFSSSSLSAALSDPPRPSLPLPPVPDEEPRQSVPLPPIPDEEPRGDDDNKHNSQLEPLVRDPPLKNTVSPAELFLKPPTPRHKIRHSPLTSHVVATCALHSHASSSSSAASSSPAASSPERLPLSELQPTEQFYDHSPISIYPDPSPSSTPSPFDPPGSLSPADSPHPCPSTELPPIEFLAADSLLFSPAISPYYRVAPSKRQKKRTISKIVGEARLSCTLPVATDLNLRAYACGSSSCWPSGALVGGVCFATSKELLDHRRTDHSEGEASVSARPYRCALSGCGKSWKTLNGLQYHLQISTEHFRDAVSSTFRSTENSDDPSELVDDGDVAGAEKRSYVCTHPQCFKAYKQPSGLRYHLKHGHPSQAPAQLEMVPPTLAREIPKKTRKMRKKGSIDDMVS